MLVLQLKCFPWPFGKFADIVLCDKAIHGKWRGNNPVTISLLIPPKAMYGGVRGVYPRLLHYYNVVNDLLH